MAQRLAQHLISRGLLPAKVVDDAMRKLSGGTGAGLDTILLEAQAISEAGMLQALSDVSGMRLVNLSDFEPNAEAGPMLPLKISRRLTVVPLSVDGNILHLAVGYPVPHKELREVAFLLGKELELWIALECRIKDWQAALYREPMTDRFKALLRDLDPGRRGLTPAPPAAPPPAAAAKPVGQSQYPKVSAPASKPPPALPPSPALALMEEPTLDVAVEAISKDMLEKIARGVVAEPVLLTKPKKKPTSTGIPQQTVVLEPKAYAAAFGGPSMATDEQMETAVLDTTGYANFAKAVSTADAPKKRTPGDRTPTEPEMPAIVLQPPPVAPVKPPTAAGLPRITASPAADAARAPDKFPGGVLPPRSRTPEQPPTPTNKEVRAVDRAWVMPAPASRPNFERLKSSAGGPDAPPPPSAPRPPPKQPMPPPPPPAAVAKPPSQVGMRSIDTTLPNLPAPAVDEADFGDLNSTPSGRMPVVTPAPVKRAGAALPVDPPKPSVPEPPPKPIPPPPPPAAARPPELKPSQGAAPVIADEAPAAPPELAASAVSNFPAPAPSAPLGPRMVTGSTVLVVPTGNPAEWTLAQARAALKGSVQDRDKLVAVALDYGRRAFEFVGAFAVVRGAATGWAARGEGEVPEVRHVSIPLDAASVFRTVALTRGSYVGPLPPDALTQHYLALLGRSPRAVFLWPVEVKGRLVAMLYGDSGQKPVSQRKLNDFILFCQELPSAFGELIVFRKQRLGTSAAFTTADGVEHSITAPAPADAPVVDPDFAQADAEWFTGLLTLLTGPDPRERANAMTELSRTPDSSARALVRAFPGPTAWSRLPVTELPEVDELGPVPGALARLGRPAAVALAPLLDADDSDVRYLALLTAGALPHPELLDGVLRGLFDMEPDISSAARAAATAMKDVDGYETAVKALRQELASRDPLRKSLAARALGMLHDREAIEGLIGLTASEDQLCAQSAAEALRETCRANLGPNARQWAAWYAMARGRRRVEWLADALESDEFELRLAAIEELSRAFGDNLGYFADGPELERAAAVDQWRIQIQTHPDFEV